MAQQGGVQNSVAIQRLLKAEKQGQEIVQEARQYRATRVKAAREEAAQEMKLFREEQEKAFKAKEQENEDANKGENDKAQREIDAKKQDVDKAVERKGDEVVELLLKFVTTLAPEAHRNVKTAANDKALREAAGGMQA